MAKISPERTLDTSEDATPPNRELSIPHRHVRLAFRALLPRQPSELRQWWNAQQWHDEKGQPMEDPLHTYACIKDLKRKEEQKGAGGVAAARGRDMGEFRLSDHEHLATMSADVGRALTYLTSFLRFPEDMKQPTEKLGTAERDLLSEFFTAIRDGNEQKVAELLRRGG
jgi:hypothetical protein